MIDVDPTVLALEFVASAVIGALLGFGTKRIARLLTIVVGVQLMGLRYLESRGIIVVDYDRLTAGLVGAPARAAELHWFESLLSTIPIGAGFVSGFVIGFHRA